MYIREVHADGTIPELRQLITENPLGILTTGIRSESYPFLQSSHIAFVLDIQDSDSDTEFGILRGHLARANPQSKAIIELLKSTKSVTNILQDEVLVLFNSTAQHYVTPKFYTDTKPSSGKVVPTWNYAAAQVYGQAKIYWDHRSEDTIRFLNKQIHDLSDHAESSIMGYNGQDGVQSAWSVDDAPSRYIDLLRTNIIGMEIKIERLEGKFKMSQEMSLGDREGVARGFSELESDVGDQISTMVRERSANKEASNKSKESPT